METEVSHLFEWSPVGLLLFESNDASAQLPEQWVCKVANQAAENLLGRLPLDGLNLAELFPEPVASHLSDSVTTNPVNSAVDFFVSLPGKWMLASGNRVATQLSVTLTDITKQKEAAFADRNMLNLYRSLSNSLSDNEIILFDKHLNIVLTEGKPRFVRLNVEGELKGKNLSALFEQNEFSFLGEYVNNIFGGGRSDVEREINGKFYKASVYADTRDDDGQENIVGVLLLKDVTELNKKQRELQIHVEQLNRSNKELEEFAYVASHDLQEPLRKIMSFSDRLVRKFSSSLHEEGQMYLTRMNEAAKRMERLLDDLLIFSRATRNDRPLEPTDLQQTLVNVLDDLDDLLKKAKIEFPDNLPVIQSLPSHMYQLFQNLISNALKFCEPGKTPVLRIGCQEMTGAQLPEHQFIADQRYCVITFEDEGIGFDQVNAERIFTIFQRLHGRSEYSGTGIGLAICKKIVENYGGIIFAKGLSGKGSIFTIILPIK